MESISVIADVLLSVVVPEIHKRVQSFLLQNSDIPIGEAFQSTPGLLFWLKMMESINDSYSLERMTEQLLKQLAARNTGDIEAHWILWILFHQVYQKQASIRLLIFTMHYYDITWIPFPSVLKRLLIWDTTSCFYFEASFHHFSLSGPCFLRNFCCGKYSQVIA